MNDQDLAAQIKSVARRIGIRGPLPVARMVSPTEMVAASSDPARPAGAKIWSSGELWWSEACPVTESGLVHELSHWLLATSASAPLFPHHHDADVDGHGALFAALAWALTARAGTVPNHQQYDLGHAYKPGDRPADPLEERWARRWAWRPHSGTTAEALAAGAIRDYRRWCQARALVAAAVPFLRLLAALAAAISVPALLAHMI